MWDIEFDHMLHITDHKWYKLYMYLLIHKMLMRIVYMSLQKSNQYNSLSYTVSIRLK